MLFMKSADKSNIACARCSTLETQLESVKTQLAAVRAAPPPEQNPVKVWHQRANNIIGAEHSRGTASHAYDCAHAQNDGCTWQNKRVTLQAYVLHLQRKHQQKISNTPNLDLLPVRVP